MQLNISKKIAYSELVIVALIFIIYNPYLLYSMDFTPYYLAHYLFVTMVILAPLGFLSLFYFIDRWECRPIEMLSFYLESGFRPPDDVLATARERALNLPLVHSISIIVRYQFLTVADCLYMGLIGDLENLVDAELALTVWDVLLSGIPLALFGLAGVGLLIRRERRWISM